MAPLFGRGRAKAALADSERESLRTGWERHAARLPPNTLQAIEFVEFRAELAELDVKASRYIGAVLTDHAGGLAPPIDDATRLLNQLPELARQFEEVAPDEIQYYRNQTSSAMALLQLAKKVAQGAK